MVLQRESHVLLTALVILLISFFSTTTSFNNHIITNEAEVTNVQRETLEQQLQGKSTDEVIAYLDKTFGEGNVEVIGLSEAQKTNPITGQQVLEKIPLEVVERCLNQNGFNKLPKKSNVRRQILEALQKWVSGDYLQACMQLGRIMTGAKGHHMGKYNVREIKKFNRVGTKIAECIGKEYCWNPDGTPKKYPQPEKIPIKDPKTDPKTEYRIPPQTPQPSPYTNPYTVNPEPGTPPPIPRTLGPGTGEILVWTGAGLIIIIIIVCGAPYLIPVLIAAKEATVAFLAAAAAGTSGAQATAGLAVASAMLLATGASSQNPLTLQQLQNVQQQYMNGNPTALQQQYGPQSCGPLTPSRGASFNGGPFIPPGMKLIEIPRTPITGFSCAEDPGILQKYVMMGIVPEGLGYWGGLNVNMWIGIPFFPTSMQFACQSGTQGLRKEDINIGNPTINNGVSFNVDFNNFCDLRGSGTHKYAISCKAPACDPFTVGGSVNCDLNMVYTNLRHPGPENGAGVTITTTPNTGGLILENEFPCSGGVKPPPGEVCAPDDCATLGQKYCDLANCKCEDKTVILCGKGEVTNPKTQFCDKTSKCPDPRATCQEDCTCPPISTTNPVGVEDS